ncbi:MAG: hypothetical protein GY790_08550, partial [Bacteroidetes bacterium]|nr:hypothetical protein [Bacteroidota bacterium]
MKSKKLHAILFVFLLGTFSTISFFSNQLKAQSGYPVIDTSDMEASYYFHGSFRDSTGKNAAAYPQSTILTSDRFCHPMSAAQLTNPNSYLRVEDHAALDFTDVLSISFWIYLDSLPESETRIISKSDPASPSEDSYWISIYPGDETSSGTPWSFSFRDADGTVQTFRSEWGMITEDWEYYTVTFDGSNVTMYMDLEPVAEFNTGSTTILPNAHPLWIGNLVENGITGKFDDIVLYSRIIQVQELEEYIVQSILWPDNERPLLGTCAGETVDLISRHQGPLLQYTFFKDGDIIQDGGDSICSVTIEAESDFGEYSCLAYNCIESHTKYFDVEQVFNTTGMEVIEQPYEFSQHENSVVRIRLTIEGTTDLTTYQWYHNGVPVDKRNKNREIDNLSASDTGYYYCEITDQCTKIYTDSIHVMLLSRETYPSVDTSGLRAFYAFAGNYTDSTGNTGPGVVSSVVPDTGIFGTPSQSARFSGDDSYLEIPEDPDLDIMDQLTIALSLKI